MSDYEVEQTALDGGKPDAQATFDGGILKEENDD